ncbi:L,D-transpeptidase [Pararhodobacter zhoushanensis]|uniref:L,D-transpeptidase n=1 Tax=Pararhodobacter zhoushanensis TaxID=2479545 RepID=A0ABT3H164_9RHOB|nr:L,D-transpeptidase [Pararhodobacter zhoushanensis]MCW1933584.1 L,D-transpeptidase [Pararhodobacter zhoushanensis]
MSTRRHFIMTSAGALAAPFLAPRRAKADQAEWDAWDEQVIPAGYDPAFSNPWGLASRFLPRRVQANPNLRAGDIHVDAVARYLYHIQNDGTAMRYGVAIGRDDLYEPGVYTIRRKVRWPSWTPTANMIRHTPSYEEFAGGMPGGPENPLGARALYLYVGERDTYLRIHGTPQPWSIGQRASSGCVRMVMAHIIDLFEQVELGAVAHLYDAE